MKEDDGTESEMREKRGEGEGEGDLRCRGELRREGGA